MPQIWGRVVSRRGGSGGGGGTHPLLQVSFPVSHTTHPTSQTLDTFLGALLAAVQPDIGWRVTFPTLFAVLRSATCVLTKPLKIYQLNTTKKCDSSV
jgi:hypothetical protein